VKSACMGSYTRTTVQQSDRVCVSSNTAIFDKTTQEGSFLAVISLLGTSARKKEALSEVLGTESTIPNHVMITITSITTKRQNIHMRVANIEYHKHHLEAHTTFRSAE